MRTISVDVLFPERFDAVDSVPSKVAADRSHNGF